MWKEIVGSDVGRSIRGGGVLCCAAAGVRLSVRAIRSVSETTVALPRSTFLPRDSSPNFSSNGGGSGVARAGAAARWYPAESRDS